MTQYEEMTERIVQEALAKLRDEAVFNEIAARVYTVPADAVRARFIAWRRVVHLTSRDGPDHDKEGA